LTDGKSSWLQPLSPCDLEDLDDWVHKQIEVVHPASCQTIIAVMCKNLDDFVRWPEQAHLFWPGCIRDKYHDYPEQLRVSCREHHIPLDARSNGPAIASFLFAGGVRPLPDGRRHAWPIHHLYSGEFPYLAREHTVHAVKEGNHFTQSAGLVAIHPVAHAAFEEYPPFAWYLRALAFRKYRYDPDMVFTMQPHDELGFTTSDGGEPN
jgi:hypothetical protein